MRPAESTAGSKLTEILLPSSPGYRATNVCLSESKLFTWASKAFLLFTVGVPLKLTGLAGPCNVEE